MIFIKKDENQLESANNCFMRSSPNSAFSSAISVFSCPTSILEPSSINDNALLCNIASRETSRAILPTSSDNAYTSRSRFREHDAGSWGTSSFTIFIVVVSLVIGMFAESNLPPL